jgi:hypothetical protein
MALVVGTNSYGSQAEADSYFADSLKASIWAAFTVSQKDAGLIEVARVMERSAYKGQKELDGQEMSFPRSGVTDCAGNPLTPEETLDLAKEAQFEYAILAIQNPAILSNTNPTAANTKRLKAGSAEIEYFRPSKGGGRYPAVVQEILRCVLTSYLRKGISGSYVSGNGDGTTFDNDYNKTQGFY